MIPQRHWHLLPARELPKIEIEGVQFYVDMRIWECRDVNDFMNRFSLDELVEVRNGNMVLFDPVNRNLFHGTGEEYDLRKSELKIVKLPTLKQIDPIGYRALLGLGPKKESGLLQKKRQRPSKGKKP